VETNVFIGKLIDQTFHCAGRVRACTPLKIYWHPLGCVPPC